MADPFALSQTPALEVDALLRAEHADPFKLLGLHHTEEAGWVVRCLIPGAQRIEVIDSRHHVRGELVRLHGDCFAGPVHAPAGRFAYRLRVYAADSAAARVLDDPYRFGPQLGELDLHLLGQGQHWRVWQALGAHLRSVDGVRGTVFAVWAPNARRVSVVGPFNHWDGRVHPMRRRDAGIWELFVPGVSEGDCYKFEVLDAHGQIRLKSDPLARRTEVPPATASRVEHERPFEWQDAAWMSARAQRPSRDSALSIYEVHIGSWRRTLQGEPLDYDDLADTLVPYAVAMGFTHIELLPITEHPFGGSWGYQPTALFAPSARWGDPDGLRRLIDRAHGAGLGVILDWVPAHFPTDEHGLARFDGTALYEHEDPSLGRHADWGTLIYNFGRFEVANFLIANALYWLHEFHIDGLRVDAVASMLYLDYSRPAGTWRPNVHGGNENLEAVAFIRRLNEKVYEEVPGAITLAEESTAWPGVSRPTWLGGLGFGYKWNMGWMHDTLGYLGKDPIHRHWHHHQLTFAQLYAYSENYVLPLSHDEVVHGKGSLIARMPGDPWQRFANLRSYFAFMWTQPGKKLLFMGGEFGQVREWNHDASLDWHLLEDGPERALHRGLQTLVADLNRLYRELPALHRFDCEPAGFEWIDCEDSAQSVLVWMRRGEDPAQCAVVVCNFTPVIRESYRIGLPFAGRWQERLNTDAHVYGGSDVGNLGAVQAEPVPWHARPCSVALRLPPLSALILVPELGAPA